jgi:transcriptional regulator with XRE-family HTH domain
MGASVRRATVDWPRIIGEMRDGGMTVKAMAKRVGMSANGLSNILHGSTAEPCFSVGQKLLELYAGRVKSYPAWLAGAGQLRLPVVGRPGGSER